ncbi:MAG TPA: 2-succinyl-5-enolpyruvyl-6-hydroxy-3-cyclohexene-1-carboxylic-acid synthase [Gemmatimonadaceae bacterium]|nr:2-succinyl-5-enolpyruvyl-6-hydroxy-3-cyclohexene-1-carboxylic-acid synthase [Gemmatimonadaceae bacterium]
MSGPGEGDGAPPRATWPATSATSSPARAAHAYVGAFVDELARSGVRHACVAPGSRSTPLALTLAAHPAIRVWMHLDERSAAFFALGMAKWSGRPVALLCTSGTAAANFLPAVVEARQGRVPLVVLTADRPPELREVGAAQTIDQNRLFGAHAKWFVEAALPEATAPMLRYARTLACRAAATAAAAPAGPVHLNLPFREPLVPEPVAVPPGLSADDALAWTGRPDGEPWVRVHDAPRVPDAETVAWLGTLLRDARRPLVVCGPQPDARLGQALGGLAERLGAPLLADPLSQLRWGAHPRGAVIDAYDAFLRDAGVAAELAPDVVLRVGAIPTSKPLLQYLERHGGARQVVVDVAEWPDPSLRAAAVVHAEARAVCEGVVAWLGSGRDDGVGAGGPAESATRGAASGGGRGSRGGGSGSREQEAGSAGRPAARGAPPNGTIAAGAAASIIASPQPASAWLARWRALDARARRAIDVHLDRLAEPFEGRVLRDVAAALPDGATLWVSSSMPVRDLDGFAAGDGRALRVLANRGANGIDGVVSSALGAAAAAAEAGAGPLVLVVGDLAFYHDLNGLLAARLHALHATIVLVNNDGGGIFSFLPQAAQPAHFERLFGTPHGLDFRHAAALYGASYVALDAGDDVGAAVRAALPEPRLDVIEVRTERARNVVLHRAVWAAVAAQGGVTEIADVDADTVAGAGTGSDE